MATTLTYKLTAEPTDIKAPLSLADGTLYSCQYDGPGYAKVWQGGTAPPDGAANAAFIIEPLEFVDLYIEPSENTYAWFGQQVTGEGNLILSLIPEGA